jgi:Amt family ammonium transporter
VNWVGAVLAFFLPVGVMIIAWSGLPPHQSRRAASAGLLALAIAAIAYMAAGFAFQFGGIWHVTPLDAYRPLDQFWSVPDPTGHTWSVVGLSGFMLSGPLGADALVLFLHFLPLVMMAVMIPLLALAGRVHALVLAVVGMSIALVIMPLTGHWVWAGGWLAALGKNLQLGHGYVDVAGASAVYAASGLLALLGLRVVAAPRDSSNETPQLPETRLPLLAVVGAVLFSLGWMAWLVTDPFHPASGSFNLPLGLVNGLLAAAAATVVTQLFSWFASSRVDPLMAARGWLAGCIIVSAAAPFLPAWSALMLGVLAGVLVPVSMAVADHLLRLDDATAAISIYGLPGVIGALAVGLFADGRWGAGWNGIGAQEYLLVKGQGVTGLVTAAGYAADSGQLTAQLAGVGAIVFFALVVGGGVMLVTRLVVRGK